MTSIPPDLRTVAERVIWFESAEEALRHANRFLTYLMTYGTLDEILTARKYFSDDDFRSALLNPVQGIFDVRSWTYWNGVYGRHPVPDALGAHKLQKPRAETRGFNRFNVTKEPA